MCQYFWGFMAILNRLAVSQSDAYSVGATLVFTSPSLNRLIRFLLLQIYVQQIR